MHESIKSIHINMDIHDGISMTDYLRFGPDLFAPANFRTKYDVFSQICQTESHFL